MEHDMDGYPRLVANYHGGPHTQWLEYVDLQGDRVRVVRDQIVGVVEHKSINKPAMILTATSKLYTSHDYDTLCRVLDDNEEYIDD